MSTQAIHLRVYDDEGTIEYITVPASQLVTITTELHKNGYRTQELTFLPIASINDFPR